MESSEINTIINQYEGKESAVLAILQDIQSKEKYLPKEILEQVSQKMKIPMTHIFRLATFYNALSIKPRGKHKIDVCLGTACHVRGGNKIMDKLERDLSISVGETTKINNLHWNPFDVWDVAVWVRWLSSMGTFMGD